MIDSHKMSGTNAERLLLVPGNDFISFYETDTNAEYEWKGTEWIQTKTNGEKHVRIIASDVIDPANNVYPDTITIAQSAASYDSAGDCSGFSHGVIQVTSVHASDSLLIQGYLDAAKTKLSDAILLYTTAGVAATASAIAAAATYYIRDSAFHGFKITKTGSNGAAGVEIVMKA